MTCSAPAIIHRPELGMLMSAKLDRLVVGSILKQEGLSKSVSDRCGCKFACGLYRPLHILLLEFAENASSERTMDGH
jgi:hypothetical protein